MKTITSAINASSVTLLPVSVDVLNEWYAV